MQGLGVRGSFAIDKDCYEVTGKMGQLGHSDRMAQTE